MLDEVRLGPADEVGWAVVWGVTVGIMVVPRQHRLIAPGPAAAPVGPAHEWGLAPAELGLGAATVTA
ncbi:hypothetical protein SAMN06272771_7155 [Streptomyces sp. Ag82_O1-12]|nr:hypothetical protein SAMN06272771_7155 [Streptomyces sp. Ag82_O1-12]SOD49666.1 hypothetical protein SAMN06272727_7161 [Streptomyces sp. Ag82_G6-1]